ncbi:MAG: SpoIIE family protein phosphatase [Bacteroidetes bacterium]|nr:SpoIIE family protein phosphatase [Bacteroidota bacterium]
MQIKERIGDKSGISKSLSNIGNIYLIKLDYVNALDFYLKGLKIQNEIEDRDACAISYNDIGTVYTKLKKYKEAYNSFYQSISIAREINSYVSLKDGYENLSKLDSITNNFENSLKNYKLFTIYKDSLYNEERTKKIVQSQMQYDFDKKESATKAEQERKDILITKESEKQRQIRNSILGGFIFVLIISLLLYRSRQIKQRNNTELLEKNSVISQQKELVEIKNKEILDSISYAKRIQATILPSVRVVKKYLEDSFILYLPKDIVAGDFYWMESIADESIVYFAACDCTGHGVPGAMVSVVCHNALNKALKEFEKRTPAEILDKVSEMVIEDFNKNADDDDEVKDGMDASLCALNIESGQLQWAGANNALWIIKPNGTLNEYKPNKQPVGKSYDRTSFTNHTIQLEKGDTLYLFTDGYADQFGGTESRKFQRKGFKELLVSIHQLTMEQQREAIYTTFESWRGANEQVDDVCIIGVRV